MKWVGNPKYSKARLLNIFTNRIREEVYLITSLGEGFDHMPDSYRGTAVRGKRFGSDKEDAVGRGVVSSHFPTAPSRRSPTALGADHQVSRPEWRNRTKGCTASIHQLTQSNQWCVNQLINRAVKAFCLTWRKTSAPCHYMV